MNKKLGLVHEGSDDAAFLTPLISRALGMPPTGIIARAGAKSIKGIKQGLKSRLKEFHQLDCTHVLICTDNDRVSAAERERLKRAAKDIVAELNYPIFVHISVPIQALEAWIISRHEFLAARFDTRFTLYPNPEEIEFPKDYLSRLQLNPAYADWEALGQQIEIDPRNQQNERVPSFKELLLALEEWKRQ